MDEKAKILCYLFENNILAPSASRLASDVGESDKKLYTGKWGGRHVSERKVNDIWNRVMYSYNISDYTLNHLPQLWELSNELSAVLTEDNFLRLCMLKLSCVKDSQLRESLRAIYRESLVDYYFILALFYTKVSGYDVNSAKNSQLFIEVLTKADMVLHRKYPEGEIAHGLVLEYISKAQRYKFLGWTLLMVFVGYVICYYTHPLFIDQMQTQQFPPIPMEEETWWMESDGIDEPTALWRLSRLNDNCGLYDVIVIKLRKGKEIGSDDCSVFRIGFQEQYHTIQFSKTISAKKFIVSFYTYLFSEDHTRLEFTLNEQLSGKNPLPMPSVLTRIAPEELKEYTLIDLEKIDGIETDIKLSTQGLEYTDMEVVDVTMTRNSCTLHIRQSNSGLRHFKIDIDEDSSLRSINVWDEVVIIRGKADGELYAEWESPCIRVPIPKGVL